MTDKTFTPGPWDWFSNNSGEILLATPDRGRLFVMSCGRKGMQGATPRFSSWDGVDRERQGGIMLDAQDFIGSDGVMRHPDAHLIAASPDLYEALVVARHYVKRAWFRAGDNDTGENATLDMIDDALAKARGESE